MARGRSRNGCTTVQKLVLALVIGSGALLVWRVLPLLQGPPGFSTDLPSSWRPHWTVDNTTQAAAEPPQQQQPFIVETTHKEQPLLVVLASDSENVDGLLVAINSALSNAADPSRLLFKVVTFAAEASALLEKVRVRLPGSLALEAVAFDAWLPRVSGLLGGKSSSRKELFGALNFAAFYIHELFPNSERALYLDTDVVVLSDLAKELTPVGFNGMPAAVAEDCSQKLGKYVDLDRLKKKGVKETLSLKLKAKKDTCVVNRGVVLVNVRKWAELNVTGVIETLVAAHLSKKGPLWRSGVSQPPFLLAIAGRFYDLGAEFNVRGLGRGDMAPDEVAHYKKLGLWNAYYASFHRKCQYHCCPGCKGFALTPYISPNAHKAHILHFNGRLKPSTGGRRDLAPVLPPKLGLDPEMLAKREQIPLCSCGASCLQECAGLWWKYFPAAAVPPTKL